MDELRRFCVRMLGDGPAADAARRAAGSAGPGDRLGALSGAVRACREPGEAAAEVTGETETAGAAGGTETAGAGGGGIATEGAASPGRAQLAAAIAGELRAATARLSEAQREGLALRELLGLSYDELAEVMEVNADAVPNLLARARIALRGELRDSPTPISDCPEYERALRTIAQRQDGEPAAAADEDWLVEHLGHCGGCGRAHAAMLEATACYRAWSDAPAPSATSDDARGPTSDGAEATAGTGADP